MQTCGFGSAETRSGSDSVRRRCGATGPTAANRFCGDVCLSGQPSKPSVTELFSSGGFMLEQGGGHRPQIVASPPSKNSRTLDTLWSIDFQKKLVNLMSDFKAKMHKIRLPTPLGSFQRSPDP